MNLACNQCGKTYDGRSSSKFCSRECSFKSQKNHVIVKCLCCGKDIKTKPSQKNRKKYCSKDCMDKYRKTVTERECPQCGIMFTPKGNKTKCCSRSCASKLKLNNKDTREKILNNLIREQTAEMKKNQRVLRIKQISKNKFNGHQVMPSWNPKACDYFEEFDQDNNTSGQHARNGGELHVKELGYFIDYINHDLKLIMEYDEKYHNSSKQKEKDIIRQQEIQELYPDYEFKRIKEQKEII